MVDYTKKLKMVSIQKELKMLIENSLNELKLSDIKDQKRFFLKKIS
jgi:hypothetical protein